jgi:hypothetical protein
MVDSIDGVHILQNKAIHKINNYKQKIEEANRGKDQKISPRSENENNSGSRRRYRRGR